ncbi:hypothetical protein ACP70R_011189 [Stipagrostis hirtigluma subsp. patula]
MSPFISTSPASHTSCSCLATMFSSSSPLAPKGQLMKLTTAVLLILLSIVLFASSCESSRGLRVDASKGGSSKSPAPGKQDVASLKIAGCPTSRQTKTLSKAYTATDEWIVHADAKVKEGVAMAVSSPAGAVRATPVASVSQRLSQREDTAFHLDYAGPRTHTPSHN